MNTSTVYRCEGTCTGATFKEGKNCGAQDCNLYDKPLKPYTQCGACTALSEQDQKAHGCAQCAAA